MRPSRPTSSTASDEVPVVVDLWAPWCGPCTTLGPILEQVSTHRRQGRAGQGRRRREPPESSQAFQVQSIPAVYALKDGAGRGRLHRGPGRGCGPGSSSTACCPARPRTPIEALVAAGDEASLRAGARALEPERRAGCGRAGRPAGRRRSGRRGPAAARRGSPRHLRPAASRRWPARGEADRSTVTRSAARLDGLLDRVKDDDDARQEFVDLLELLGPDDPRTAAYRKSLSQRLF